MSYTDQRAKADELLICEYLASKGEASIDKIHRSIGTVLDLSGMTRKIIRMWKNGDLQIDTGSCAHPTHRWLISLHPSGAFDWLLEEGDRL